MLDIQLFQILACQRFGEAGPVQCTLVPAFGEPLFLVKHIATDEIASCKYFSLHFNKEGTRERHLFNALILTFRNDYI